MSFLFRFARKMKEANPAFYDLLLSSLKKYFGKYLGVYPRPLAKELKAVKDVLYSPGWNMAYGRGLVHEKLESEFAEYLGVRNAISVNTGGMALQMSMRALGLKLGDEVLLQVDTCSATAMAIMNAGCTPIFSDISDRTFMLDKVSLRNEIGPRSKAVIATHMWGNSEDMDMITSLAAENEMFVIEDACLSLGTKKNGKMAGARGNVGVFSFGCLKPIQGGEGGMIVTDDDSLARELRSLRHWGDRTIDFGTRDVTQLAWNGRLSEIVAAVVREQLRGYPRYLEELREQVLDFSEFIKKFDGIEMNLGSGQKVSDSAFTQIVLRIDEKLLKMSKADFREKLAAKGIGSWHANFESINTLSLFRTETWKEWILSGDFERIRRNYLQEYVVSNQVYVSSGLGIAKTSFGSASRIKHLKRQLESLLVN